MYKIEQELLDAIRSRKDWAKANTSTEAHGEVVAVYLYGNHIADAYPDGRIEPNCITFSAWPTQTTRSRLRALGVDATIKKGHPHIDGKPI